MTYSETVLDHSSHPRAACRMLNAETVGVAGAPGHGRFMLVFLRFEGERIAEASYQMYGCVSAIAAGTALVELLSGLLISEAGGVVEDTIDTALGGLPIEKRHCTALASAALASALDNRRTSSRSFP
jgi:nitrogen fixation protein NifU and related proteins